MEIIDKNGKKYSYTSSQSKKIDVVLQWWQNPQMYPVIPVQIVGEKCGKMSFILKFLIWGIWLLIIVGGFIYEEMARKERYAEDNRRLAQQHEQQRIYEQYDRERQEYYNSGEWRIDMYNGRKLKYQY